MSGSESLESEGASLASSTSTQWPSQSSYYSTQSNIGEEQTLRLQEILDRAMDENNFELVQPELDGEDRQTNDKSDAIKRAAQLLHSAEVLLAVTGAGFSADSGLATYIDVADIDAYRERGWRYRDLCRPFVTKDGVDVENVHDQNDSERHVSKPQDANDADSEHQYHPLSPCSAEDYEMRQPEYFYGFWGQCINDYRKVAPHEGYNIVARWGRDKNRQSEADDTLNAAKRIQLISQKLEAIGIKTGNTSQEPYYVSPTEKAGAFFFFTSNVDAHSYDVLPSHEIRECHGNTEVWQCRNFDCGTNATSGLEDDEVLSGKMDKGGDVKTWKRRLWRLPLDHVFEVDTATMSAPPTKTNETAKPEIEQQQTVKNDPSNRQPSQTLPRKRKSESELCDQEEDKTEVLDFLQNQFAAASDTAIPAHIGDVHGRPRKSHLKNMMHPAKLEEPDYYLPVASFQNWPRCPRCNDLARPAVLMFDDLDWVYNLEQEKRWQRWCQAVIKICKSRASGEFDEDNSLDSEFTSVNGSDISNEGWENVSESESLEGHPMPPESRPSSPKSVSSNALKVLILEIGCGYNVPTCRMISETMLQHLADRGGDPNLVRINPTHPEADNDEIEDRFIGIEDKEGLRVLKEIDVLYRDLLLNDNQGG